MQPCSGDSGTTSVLDVQSGTLDVRTANLDPQGVIRIDAGATAAFAGDLVLRPSSVIDIEVASASSFGTLAVTGTLGFAPFGVGDPDQSLARLVAPFSGPGSVDIILCGGCSGAQFDEFDLDLAAAIFGANTITLSTVNTFVGVGAFASWNNPANWSFAAVPAGEEAIVPAGFSATVLAGSTAVISELTLDGTLDVNGTAWLGDAAIVGTGSVENNGTVLVQRRQLDRTRPHLDEHAGSDRARRRPASWTSRTRTTTRTASLPSTRAPDVSCRTTGSHSRPPCSSSRSRAPRATLTDFGQLELRSGVLTSAGTLRAIDNSDGGFTFDDIYPLIVCSSGSCVSDPVSAFDTIDANGCDPDAVVPVSCASGGPNSPCS